MNPVSDNPLLAFPGLPPFDAIRPEHVTPAVDTLLASLRTTLARVGADSRPPTYATVVEPLADALDRLDRAWSAVSHLNAVVSTPALRDTYSENLPKITAFFTEFAHDPVLYAKYRAVAAAPEFAQLAPAQRMVVAHELRDFRLGGADLSPAQKSRFKEVQEALAQLGSDFEDNLLDATNAWSLYVAEARLAGVPPDVVAEAKAAATADGRSGCKLTLLMPCYLPVVLYAEDRALRAELHRAYMTRASELGADPRWDNTAVIARTLALRHEEARLLGYANYAEVSLVPKMAGTPDEVLAFLHDMARRARPHAERDLAELSAFARDELGLPKLEPWDLAYASERLKLARYAYSEQDVKQYFPEDRVLAGLFRLVETLYGVTIRESAAPTWHDDVRFFEIRDGDGTLAGQFYMDNYARENKRGGAWMDDPINRRRLADAAQHPVAYLTCNLARPVGGQQALFTHNEVITLFHEFGHGLHQLLTRIDVPGVSGLQGVEWDAVELPSQFMENFCWEWEVLQGMTAHVATGAPLPRALFDKMIAARNFQSGLGMLRHVEAALFDMLLHKDYDPAGGGAYASPEAVLAAVRKEVRIVPVAPYDRFIHGFAHVFAGGYAAGYYSYQWAEVLSADAFSLFEETGVLSPATGTRFRDEILARGGSRPAMESFVAFRGRPPQLDALLRHNGMTMSS
jgi:oligopeptidase A